MKQNTLIGRLVGSLSIPAFAGIAGGLLSIFLFSAIVALEVIIRSASEGTAPRFSVPILVIVGMLAGTVLIASTFCYLLARPLQDVVMRFTDYMMTTRGDAEADLQSLQFPELRRLRVATTRTVRKLRRENDYLRKIAYRDSRTGLPNAIACEKKIAETLLNASFERPAAFMLLDIDRFAHLVEQVGASHGELMIHAAAQRIARALTDVPDPSASALRGSMLAALTADQFTLYMPDAGSREHVIAVARAIRNAFAEPFTILGRNVTMSLSGGIVMAPEDADSPQKLMQHAKLALRLVRNESQSGFRFFTPRLTRIVQGRYRFEAELRDAVENREFKAVFQPKIDFATGRIVGAEALARWRRSNGKLISPAAFIPVAEEAGLIEEIGRQILEAACEAARAWELEGHDVTVAVNVSPSQFQRNDLTETVMSALKNSGLHPRRLELEITESMAVSDPARVAEFISPLRAMGTKLAIDDFGTGHSNLATLTQLPFDVFKIDRQFVSALETDRQAPAIVEMILAMAETLGLQTVAEGVETTKQADFLRRRGCTMAQGFLYSPGLPDQAFIELLRAWKPLGANDETGSPGVYQAPRR
ncbi:MAG: putative bifunctional diguanylate cyclase/phosphodiesterase [Hyphomonas sp.]